MSSRAVHHETFSIERTFPAPVAKVYRALTDPVAKAQWFLPPGEWKAENYRFDCRVGGTEHVESTPPGGAAHVYDAIYHEVLPERRLVFSYDMHIADQHLSVSLSTFELFEVEGGTKVVFTEQGAFLDGNAHDAAARVEGSEWMMNNLEAAVSEDAVSAG